VKILYNDNPFELKSTYFVNNMKQHIDYLVQDRDVIEVRTPRTLQDFFTIVSTEKLPDDAQYEVFVNNQRISFTLAETQVLVNEKPVTLDYKLKENDRLTVSPKNNPTVAMLLKQMNKKYYHELNVTFNSDSVTMKQPQLIIKRKNKVLELDEIIYHNDQITIEDKIIETFIFQDVFRYVDIDLTNANGRFMLTKNNEPTTFYEPIMDGDHLSIVWE
jgi:hypothetical protein